MYTPEPFAVNDPATLHDFMRENPFATLVTATPEGPQVSHLPLEWAEGSEGEPDRLLKLRADYSYREDNWRIGRLVKTRGLKMKKFRTSKQWFRHRRWRRERELAGQREAQKKRAESGEDIKKGSSKKKPMSKKAAKKAAKKSK